MRQNELEEWVLRIADRVNTKQPIEDSRVELKSDWIDPIKAARRIAGHANAAHGEDILWVIGIDEDNGVVGASKQEQHEWLKKVENSFDDICPELRIEPLVVSVDAKSVVAFLFSTSRAPYVVSNPAYGSQGGGPVEREIPWRSATGIRSAKRSDLIRLLGPVERRPKIEIVSGFLQVSETGATQTNNAGSVFESRLYMDIYVTYRAAGDLVIPFHRCHGSISLLNSGERSELNSIQLQRSRRGVHMQDSRDPTPNVSISPQDVIIKGPGMVQINALLPDMDVSPGFSEKANVSISLRPVDSDESIDISTDFVKSEDDKNLYITYEYIST